MSFVLPFLMCGGFLLQGADAGQLLFFFYQGEIYPSLNFPPLWSRKGSYGQTWRFAQAEVDVTQYKRVNI